METYLFYTTHMVMITCTAVIIYSVWPRHQAEIKRVEHLHSVISLLNKLKAIYRFLRAEQNLAKILIVNILNIGMQITNQILK